MGINPWAGFIVLISIAIIIIAWKGTQDKVLSAVLGRPYTPSSSSNANASTNPYGNPGNTTGPIGTSTNNPQTVKLLPPISPSYF